jgi:uncharacterized protein YkwD
MYKILMSLILLNLTLGCGSGFDKEKPTTYSSQQEQHRDTFSINQEYLLLVNDHRISLGLSPLSYSVIVEEVGHVHSKGMALHTRPFGHYGLSLRCRRLRNRLGPVKKCGEVVAMGQKDLKAVFQAWLDSPKHREALVEPSYTHTGLSFSKDRDGVIYWTQMFVEL